VPVTKCGGEAAIEVCPWTPIGEHIYNCIYFSSSTLMGAHLSSKKSSAYDPFSLVFQDHYVLNAKVLGRGCYGEVKAGRLRHNDLQSKISGRQAQNLYTVNAVAPPREDESPRKDGVIDPMSLKQRLENRMRTSCAETDGHSFLCGPMRMSTEPFAVKLLKRRLLDKEVLELEDVQSMIDELQGRLLSCTAPRAPLATLDYEDRTSLSRDDTGVAKVAKTVGNDETMGREERKKGEEGGDCSEATTAYTRSISKGSKSSNGSRIDMERNETKKVQADQESEASKGSRSGINGTTSTKASKKSSIRKSRTTHEPASTAFSNSMPDNVGLRWRTEDNELITQSIKHQLGLLRKRRAKLLKETRKLVSRERVVEELTILSECTHKHIVRLVEAFESRDFVHIVYERAFGDAFSRVCACKKSRVPESVCKKWTRQLLEAAQYLNQSLVIHRDIKPENVFLKTRRADGDIVLGDFGMSIKLKSVDEKIEQIAGSAAFLAPETWSGHYQSLQGDVWAIGVTAYNVLARDLPYHQSSHESSIRSRAQFSKDLTEARQLGKGERRFCDLAYRLGVDGVILATIVVDPKIKPDYTLLSAGAQEFLDGLMHKDCERRMTAREALGHEWLEY